MKDRNARASTQSLLKEAAQQYPNTEHMKYWLSKGADINALDEKGFGAIHFTIWGNPTDAATTRFLINHGANVNLQTKYGDTALMIAAENGQTEIVRLLLKKGVKVNLRDFPTKGISTKSPSFRKGQTALSRTRDVMKYPANTHASRYLEIIRLLKNAPA